MTVSPWARLEVNYRCGAGGWLQFELLQKNPAQAAPGAQDRASPSSWPREAVSGRHRYFLWVLTYYSILLVSAISWLDSRGLALSRPQVVAPTLDPREPFEPFTFANCEMLRGDEVGLALCSHTPLDHSVCVASPCDGTVTGTPRRTNQARKAVSWEGDGGIGALGASLVIRVRGFNFKLFAYRV